MAACGSLCLPHVCQKLAGSTKVLKAAKKPPESAVVTSTVAFMGSKWRRPPVFYFSSMMAADTEKLAADSSLSTHPASVCTCMALPRGREARPHTREDQHRRHWWRGTTRQRRRPYRRASRHAGVEQLATPHRAELERRVAEPRACLGRQPAPSGQARLVKHRQTSPVSGGLGGPPSQVICWRTAPRKPLEEWRKW